MSTRTRTKDIASNLELVVLRKSDLAMIGRMSGVKWSAVIEEEHVLGLRYDRLSVEHTFEGFYFEVEPAEREEHSVAFSFMFQGKMCSGIGLLSQQKNVGRIQTLDRIDGIPEIL